MILQLMHLVVQSCPTLQPHGLQHTRLPCPSSTPRARSNSCPSSWWCHPTVSSSVIPFSSCLQFLPASKCFPISQLFAWGSQSTRVSSLAPFKYDLNQIPYDYTVEVRNRFKGLDLIDRMPDELWNDVRDIVQETGIKTILKKNSCLRRPYSWEKKRS